METHTSCDKRINLRAGERDSLRAPEITDWRQLVCELRLLGDSFYELGHHQQAAWQYRDLLRMYEKLQLDQLLVLHLHRLALMNNQKGNTPC